MYKIEIDPNIEPHFDKWIITPEANTHFTALEGERRAFYAGYRAAKPTKSTTKDVTMPREELERTILMLKSFSHPHQSPHAEALKVYLDNI